MACLLPWLAACDDDGAGADDAGAASDANGYARCTTADRVGGFEVMVHGELTSIGGRVASGVVPADVLEPELAERGCELLRPPSLVCEPDCASGTTCDGSRCIEFPVGQDVGLVMIDGLGADVEMAPRGAGNLYFFDDPVARPPFEPGSPVTLHAGGGVTEPFSLRARGVPLLEMAEVTELRRERIAIVRWGPAAATPEARVRLVLNIANHGGTPARIECEVEDSGRFTLPLELKDRLLSLGHSGFPTLDVVRQSAGAARSGLGCVDLVVASRITVPVEIPGLVSCGTDADCPTGERCGSDLRCDGVTRGVDAEPSPGGSDAGTGDPSARDVTTGDGDGEPAGDGDDVPPIGDGGLADAGGTSGGGATSGVGASTGLPTEPDPDYGAPPVLLPLDDWCSGQHASFSFFVTSMDALWTLAGSSPDDDAGGFGGNLGGLSGADAICQTIGEATGSSRTWRAFLSATDDGFGQPVNAIERVGSGPWYDAQGRLVALDVAGLQSTRPQGDADAGLNLLDECGVPLTVHGNAHDTLTGSSALGMAPLGNGALHATCWDWTTADPSIGASELRIGHAYPRFFDVLTSGAEWIDEHPGRGCGKGRLLDNVGSGEGNCVGCTGGYGAIYCFAE